MTPSDDSDPRPVSADESSALASGQPENMPSILAQHLAELPTEIPPARDLWPSIEARIEQRSRPEAEEGIVRPRALPNPAVFAPARGPFRGSPWQQALAALFFVALGAGLAWMVLARSEAAQGAPDLADVSIGSTTAPDPRSSPAEASPAELSLASARQPEPRPAGNGMQVASAGLADSPGHLAVEADFLRAKEVLWIRVLSQRQFLTAETFAVVERNLAIIDQATRELRSALAEDPGNPALERMLYDNHRRSLHLLRQLAEKA